MGKKKEKKKKPLSSFSVDAGKRGPSSHTLNNKSETGYCNGIGNGNGDGDEMFNKQHNSEKWNADSDEEMLSLMEGFHDSFPIIRTYRNDLCNVEICGNAVRSSVLTAMATDQSFTASLNMKNNRPLTVLQTVLPGICGDHSTISTKLVRNSSLNQNETFFEVVFLCSPSLIRGNSFDFHIFSSHMVRFSLSFHAITC